MFFPIDLYQTYFADICICKNQYHSHSHHHPQYEGYLISKYKIEILKSSKPLTNYNPWIKHQ